MLCACGNPAETFGGQCDRCASLQMLGLAWNATPEEIEDAHLILVKVWHPDRFQNDPKLRIEAEEKLKEINAAHNYLLNNPQREAPSFSSRPKRPVAPPEPLHTEPPASDFAEEEEISRLERSAIAATGQVFQQFSSERHLHLAPWPSSRSCASLPTPFSPTTRRLRITGLISSPR